MGGSAIGPGGVLEGDLHLIGGGDATFGDAATVAAAFGGKGTTVESLVGALKTAGLARVRGGVVGDGSLFDSELGPPGWQLNDTPPGPVGALQFNRGIVGDSVFGTQFAIDPAAFGQPPRRDARQTAGPSGRRTRHPRCGCGGGASVRAAPRRAGHDSHRLRRFSVPAGGAAATRQAAGAHAEAAHVSGATQIAADRRSRRHARRPHALCPGPASLPARRPVRTSRTPPPNRPACSPGTAVPLTEASSPSRS
jgi:hypothetical protein